MVVLVVEMVESGRGGIWEKSQAYHRHDFGDCVIHLNVDHEKRKFERVMMAFIWDTLILKSLWDFLDKWIMWLKKII